jgi:hypothetical protein
MSICDAVQKCLPKDADENKIFLYETIWKVFCIDNCREENELKDLSGILTALTINTAKNWADKLAVKEVNVSFELNPNYLLHVSDFSLSELIKTNCFSTERLVYELLKAMELRNKTFDGIHFVLDNVIFVKSPGARMNCNSFKLVTGD